MFWVQLRTRRYTISLHHGNSPFIQQFYLITERVRELKNEGVQTWFLTQQCFTLVENTTIETCTDEGEGEEVAPQCCTVFREWSSTGLESEGSKVLVHDLFGKKIFDGSKIGIFWSCDLVLWSFVWFCKKLKLLFYVNSYP